MVVHALPAQDLAPTRVPGRAVGVLSLVPGGDTRVLPLLQAAGIAVTQVAYSADELDPAQRLIAIVLDESHPVKLLRDLVQRFRDSRVLVISSSSTSSAVRRAVDAGAAGFVPIESAASVLIPSLDAVAAGQLVIPLSSRQGVQPPMLTTREKQVLALVVMGLRNGEIAAKLYLAESTVKSHLSSAFSKLGVRSRNEAVAVILAVEAQAGRRILSIPSDSRAPSLTGPRWSPGPRP